MHDLDEGDLSTKFRGYDPFEVDGMLERARLEILDLRSRARTADDRARWAEEQLDVELTAARQAHGEANAVLATAKEEADRAVTDARAGSDPPASGPRSTFLYFFKSFPKGLCINDIIKFCPLLDPHPPCH